VMYVRLRHTLSIIFTESGPGKVSQVMDYHNRSFI